MGFSAKFDILVFHVHKLRWCPAIVHSDGGFFLNVQDSLVTVEPYTREQLVRITRGQDMNNLQVFTASIHVTAMRASRTAYDCTRVLHIRMFFTCVNMDLAIVINHGLSKKLCECVVLPGKKRERRYCGAKKWDGSCVNIEHATLTIKHT